MYGHTNSSVDDNTAAAIRQWIWGDVGYDSYSKSSLYFYEEIL